MKRFIIIVSALLAAVGCGTLGQTPEERQADAMQVRQRLDSRAYVIDINYMIPLRGSARALTSPYSITIDGSVIYSHLPYTGVVYNVPYGGGKVLNFKDDIDEYADNGYQNDRRTIVLATNNDEDLLIYSISKSEDGRADVHVRCKNRESISFRGILNPDEDVPSAKKGE